MRRFRFRMQKLLDLKLHREREWEIRLGEITGRMEDIRSRIKGCAENRRTGFEQRGGAGADMSTLIAAENYIRRMEHETGDLSRQLENLAEEREQIQLHYLEASKERKVFDRLKDRQATEFYHEQKATEFAIQDDLNGSAAARRIEDKGGSHL